MSRAATRAIAALMAAQVPHQILRYQHDPRRRTFGAEALEQLAAGDFSTGVIAGQVYKTLVVQLCEPSMQNRPGMAVAVLPVSARLSLKAMAAALGGSTASLADPAVAQRVTGYVVGGISPFGQRTALRTVVDASAPGWVRVVCSAGRRGWSVAVAPRDLIRLTGAVIADISAA